MFAKFLGFVIFVSLCIFDSDATRYNPYYRPCKYNDYKCIGRYLSDGSGCNRRVPNSLSSVYKIARMYFETPYFNGTNIDENVVIRNQDNCYVSEFYVNRKSGVTVLTVDCPNLGIEAERTFIQRETGQEDTTYQYRTRGVYPLIRTTINFGSNLDLCSASIFTELTQLPSYRVEPQSKAAARKQIRGDYLITIYEIESFLYRGKNLISKYLDALICRYNCQFP